MIARGLQRLDVQDGERWGLDCKNRLNPCVRGTYARFQKYKETHSWNKMMMMTMINQIINAYEPNTLRLSN